MKFIKSKTFVSIVSVVVTLLIIIIFLFTQNTDKDYVSENCNVFPINIRGGLEMYSSASSYTQEGESATDKTSSEEILNLLNDLKYYSSVKAILVTVDSYGGQTILGEEISSYLRHSNLPVIALIRSSADSASYYAISTANHIFASELSYVGSIGVTQSGLLSYKKNEREGYTFVEINTGKFKDTLNPDKPITLEELGYIKANLQVMHDKFVEDISLNRNMSIEKVKAIADGSSFLGKKAKELGLIDEIGNYYDAISYIEKMIKETAIMCK